MEYITLGDNQTAVGFLLASAPDRSTRFYRDALCTIALAVRFNFTGSAQWPIYNLLLTLKTHVKPELLK